MELVRKSVPYSYAGISRKLFNLFLFVASVLYAVEHSAENTRRIGYALLLAYLRTVGVQIDGAHTEVVCRNLKGATRSCAGLFKNQRNAFALMDAVGNTVLFLLLEHGRKVKKIVNLLRLKVK